MTPLRRHPSAATSLARALDNDPRRIAMVVAGICAAGAAALWYSHALSRAADVNELRRLVYGGLGAIAIAAFALAGCVWRIGRAAVSQQSYPPEKVLVPLAPALPGAAPLSGRAAILRGRVMMAVACALCLWPLAVFVLMRYIETSLAHARR